MRLLLLSFALEVQRLPQGVQRLPPAKCASKLFADFAPSLSCLCACLLLFPRFAVFSFGSRVACMQLDSGMASRVACMQLRSGNYATGSNITIGPSCTVRAEPPPLEISVFTPRLPTACHFTLITHPPTKCKLPFFHRKFVFPHLTALLMQYALPPRYAHHRDTSHALKYALPHSQIICGS